MNNTSDNSGIISSCLIYMKLESQKSVGQKTICEYLMLKHF